MTTTLAIARRSPIFTHVACEDLETLVLRSSVRQIERGASIYLQGEAAHSLFIVLDGWIKTYRMTPCGNEAVVGVFTRCSSFGEESALDNQCFNSGAEAVTQARVLQIESHLLSQTLEKNLRFCQSVLAGALAANRKLVEHVEQLKSYTGGQRIAEFLLSLCDGRTGNYTVILPYDKVLIAAWLGMKPESLSRAFRRLRGYGVTIQRDRAVIESVERLANYAEEDPAESWSVRS